MTMTESATRTLDVPGVRPTYDVRGGGSADAPIHGGEYGQAGDPDAFAAKLREVLEEN